MKIDYPSADNVPPIQDPENVSRAYEVLLDQHLFYVKKLSKQNLSCLNFLWVFLLGSAGFLFLQHMGVVVDSLIGIVYLGIGTLLAMTARLFLVSPQYDQQVACCIQQGKSLEKQYPEIIVSELFTHCDGMKRRSKHGVRLIRIFPLVTVGILTATVIALLSMR